jgi:hypothetical protein
VVLPPLHQIYLSIKQKETQEMSNIIDLRLVHCKEYDSKDKLSKFYQLKVKQTGGEEDVFGNTAYQKTYYIIAAKPAFGAVLASQTATNPPFQLDLDKYHTKQKPYTMKIDGVDTPMVATRLYLKA